MVIVAILSTCLVCPASAQSPVEEAAALDAEALRLYRAGSFSKAIVAAERSARLRREHLPEGHFEIAIGLNTLGLITQEVGRLQEAEGLYVQALAITEAARPVRSFDLALMLSNLA
ncbi:MAG: tetratricopeptide repeat protein, partial [Hyphomicrobiaceae bacterium]